MKCEKDRRGKFRVAALESFSIKGGKPFDKQETRMWKTRWIMCITLCSGKSFLPLCQALQRRMRAGKKGVEKEEAGKMTEKGEKAEPAEAGHS